MTQTILTAKEFLDEEIVKYDDLNHAADFGRVLFSSNSQFQEVKRIGVGRSTLIKFFGKNWTKIVWPVRIVRRISIIYTKQANVSKSEQSRPRYQTKNQGEYKDS